MDEDSEHLLGGDRYCNDIDLEATVFSENGNFLH